jgi:sec-independent protein translocase protein TatA
MFGIGIQELLVVLLIVLVLFGGKKLPELMKGMGDALREFKKAVNLDETVTTKKSKDSKDKS